MDAVNWLLINMANALHWLWSAVKGLFGGLCGVLDALLNPILSPVLSFFNPICTAIGDGVYALLAPLPVWCGLTILSVLAGLVMLLAFRYTSNQAAIGRVKDEIKANLLALKLYKDELRVTFQAQGRILWALAKLQRYMLPPILIMLPPMLLALAQMGVRHQWRLLHPGEQTLLTVRLAEDNRSEPRALARADSQRQTPAPVPPTSPTGGGRSEPRALARADSQRQTPAPVPPTSPTGDGRSEPWALARADSQRQTPAPVPPTSPTGDGRYAANTGGGPYGERDGRLAEVSIEPSPGLVVEAGPVPGGGKLVWRVRAGQPGRHTLTFRVGERTVQKELVVGDSFQRVSALRPGRDWTAQLLNPTEARLPSEAPVESIEILYPRVESRITGANYWILYFLVVSMLTALIAKRFFKVVF